MTYNVWDADLSVEGSAWIKDLFKGTIEVEQGYETLRIVSRTPESLVVTPGDILELLR